MSSEQDAAKRWQAVDRQVEHRIEELEQALEAQRKENERLREAGRGMLKLVEETTDDRGLPYIFPYADEIKEMKAALEEASGG